MKYIKVGSFIQSFCSLENIAPVNGESNEIYDMLVQQGNIELWIDFAIKTTKNYPYKTINPSQIMNRIMDCAGFPDSFKELLSEYFKNTEKSLEDLDAELLYWSKIISSPIPYSMTRDQSFLKLDDDGKVEEIKAIYERFLEHSNAGFCIRHFEKVPLTQNLSLLSGFMKIFSDEERVKSLLDCFISSDLRDSLSKTLKVLNDCKLTDTELHEMICEVQLTSPHIFYPRLGGVMNITITPIAFENNEVILLSQNDESKMTGDVNVNVD